MHKIKSIKDSKHFKAMAKMLKEATGGTLTIREYNEMTGN
jgi:hypothetical protein